MRYFIKTFGCQMNKHDSERMAGILESLGFIATVSPENADVIIINTCAVRENAVRRLKGYVRSLGKPKRKGALIGIAGCVAEVEKEKLLKELSFADFVFGPDRIDELPELIASASKGRRDVRFGFRDGFFASDLPAAREERYHAWVAITKGCDNSCTYCIVPYARGKLVSRRLEDVLSELEDLKKEGVLDVTLLGQNVNAYGKDIYGESRFVELLKMAAEMGFRRVSFATSHPADFQDELIPLMMEHENISRQLHLPVQSGSNRVLKRMRRGYTRERYLEIAEKVRSIQDLSLTTDIIVGFPGETDEDFEDTLDLVREIQFDHVFTFIFSPRPGTEASRYEDQVAEAVKKERFEKLTEAVREAALKQNLKLIGRVVDAVVEGESKTGGFIQARTESGKVILFEDRNAAVGKRLKLRVREAGPYHLLGELVS
jgi:tRNA-2-methylthio-N6-dimethylallyladenosine synthase